jgi:hypothetical protein
MDKPDEFCMLIKDHIKLECKNKKENDEFCTILHNIYEGCCKKYKQNKDAKSSSSK